MKWGISRDGIAMSKSIGIFKVFDIYHQQLLKKGHANLFFLGTLFYFHEDDRAITQG